MSDMDLAVFQDTSLIDQAGDPAVFVVTACERAKAWLTQAIEQGDIDQIVEIKSQAEAIRIYTIQKQLGMDAELAAAEIVRRAERGLGLAVKRGQEEGTVATQRDGGWAARNLDGADGTKKMKAADIWGNGSTHERQDAYVMAGVSDDAFEVAIDEAKAERNLARANVVRKVTKEPAIRVPAIQRIDEIRKLAADAHSAAQIGDLLGVRANYVRKLAAEFDIVLEADAVMGKTRAIDPNRVVEESISTLEGLSFGLNLIWEDFNRLDATQVERWVTSLSVSLRALNRLNKQLKEMTP